MREIWRRIDLQGEELNWPQTEIHIEQQKAAIKNIRGIDKDYFLAKVAKTYMAILGDGRGGVFCENSLDIPNHWKAAAREGVHLESFDVVLTNPPFGKKLKIDDKSILSKYKLAHKWKKDKAASDDTSYVQEPKLRDTQSPQILFVERCLQMLQDGGRLGIIAPESMFYNPTHRYIVQHIKSIARITAVISFPEELFQPFTHAKACGVVIEKTPTDADNPHNIFMAIANWCGHDSRGLPVRRDDIPLITKKFQELRKLGKHDYDRLGCFINEANIVDNIYLPKLLRSENQYDTRCAEGHPQNCRLK